MAPQKNGACPELSEGSRIHFAERVLASDPDDNRDNFSGVCPELDSGPGKVRITFIIMLLKS